MLEDSVGSYWIKAAAYYYNFSAVDSLETMREPRALSMKKYCDTQERGVRQAL